MLHFKKRCNIANIVITKTNSGEPVRIPETKTEIARRVAKSGGGIIDESELSKAYAVAELQERQRTAREQAEKEAQQKQEITTQQTTSQQTVSQKEQIRQMFETGTYQPFGESSRELYYVQGKGWYSEPMVEKTKTAEEEAYVKSSVYLTKSLKDYTPDKPLPQGIIKEETKEGTIYKVSEEKHREFYEEAVKRRAGQEIAEGLTRGAIVGLATGAFVKIAEKTLPVAKSALGKAALPITAIAVTSDVYTLRQRLPTKGEGWSVKTTKENIASTFKYDKPVDWIIPTQYKASQFVTSELFYLAKQTIMPVMEGKGEYVAKEYGRVGSEWIGFGGGWKTIDIASTDKMMPMRIKEPIRTPTEDLPRILIERDITKSPKEIAKEPVITSPEPVRIIEGKSISQDVAKQVIHELSQQGVIVSRGASIKETIFEFGVSGEKIKAYDIYKSAEKVAFKEGEVITGKKTGYETLMYRYYPETSIYLSPKIVKFSPITSTTRYVSDYTLQVAPDSSLIGTEKFQITTPLFGARYPPSVRETIEGIGLFKSEKIKEGVYSFKTIGGATDIIYTKGKYPRQYVELSPTSKLSKEDIEKTTFSKIGYGLITEKTAIRQKDFFGQTFKITSLHEPIEKFKILMYPERKWFIEKPKPRTTPSEIKPSVQQETILKELTKSASVSKEMARSLISQRAKPITELKQELKLKTRTTLRENVGLKIKEDFKFGKLSDIKTNLMLIPNLKLIPSQELKQIVGQIKEPIDVTPTVQIPYNLTPPPIKTPDFFIRGGKEPKIPLEKIKIPTIPIFAGGMPSMAKYGERGYREKLGYAPNIAGLILAKPIAKAPKGVASGFEVRPALKGGKVAIF